MRRMAGGTMKEAFLKTWQNVKKNAIKRKFSQSAEIIITLKDIDLKKQNNQIDLFLSLPHPTGKKVIIGALVGRELESQAKQHCNTVILHDDFAKHTDVKKLKKLADSHDYFIAQANIMPDIAKTFGRVFGPKGKMPNPKAGAVVAPNANLKEVVTRLQKLKRITTGKQYNIKCMVGKEDLDDAKIVENMITVYQQVLSMLPGEKANIKAVLIKLTMSKPEKVKV